MRYTFYMTAAALASCTMLPITACAQSARDIRGPSPLVAIENEALAKLIVDPPLPGPLAAGRVFIQYRAENCRIVPVFGQGALSVSPRIGHVHITVDDAPWHFVDGPVPTPLVTFETNGAGAQIVQTIGPLRQVLSGPADAATGNETERFLLVTPADSDTPALI